MELAREASFDARTRTLSVSAGAGYYPVRSDGPTVATCFRAVRTVAALPEGEARARLTASTEDADVVSEVEVMLATPTEPAVEPPASSLQYAGQSIGRYDVVALKIMSPEFASAGPSAPKISKATSRIRRTRPRRGLPGHQRLP
jgi:hypothetical protein